MTDPPTHANPDPPAPAASLPQLKEMGTQFKAKVRLQQEPLALLKQIVGFLE